MKYDKMLNDFFDKIQSHSRCSFEKLFSNFNKGELGVLRHLNSIKKEISSGEISNNLNVSTARVASILKSLESKHLILRKNDSDDKRKILIDITDEGVKLMNNINNEVSKRIEYLVNKIGLVDFEKYLDLTLKISDILNCYEEEIC